MTEPALTPRELERTADALSRHRSLRREPWESHQLRRIFGRSARPLRSTLVQLVSLGLLRMDSEGCWRLTTAGAKIIDARTAGDWEPLVRLALRAGGLEREILAFLREAETRDGAAVLPRARARSVCPGLTAVMSWQASWHDGTNIVVPLDVLQVAMATAAMEIAEGRPGWIADRERVGHRAEAYSLRLERDLRGAGAVLHVSRDEGDRLGYDIEDISCRPSRLIECKGSRSTNLNFVLTAHELVVARENEARYEIHFWGEINLARDPEAEYGVLRADGYPHVITDPARRIAAGELTTSCIAWNISDSGT